MLAIVNSHAIDMWKGSR